MTLLYLVRHGETEWNRTGRFQGNQDIPLSPEGQRQAGLLAERLAGEGFDFAYSSDLLRARETAEIILAGQGGRPKLQIDARLRELHFGVWEGLTTAEIERRYPELRKAYRNDPVHTVLTGGESPAQLQARVVDFYRDVLASGGKRILIVSHGAALKALICHLIGLDLRYRTRLEIANSGLSIVRPRKPGGGFLVCLNDTRHLDGDLDPPQAGRR